MNKFILFVFVSFLLVGCATQVTTLRPDAKSTPSHLTQQLFFIDGLLQSKTVDAAEICGGANKVARIETQLTFINGLIRGVTLGIVAPRQIQIYCVV